MKFSDAIKIMESSGRTTGFMVHFEWAGDGFLTSDYFPNYNPKSVNGEELIQNEEEAWKLAIKFAEKTVGRCVNIFVADETFSPVSGYESRMIENRS